VTRLDTTIAASSGFSVLNQVPVINVLDANVPFNVTIKVFVPSTATDSAVTLILTFSYTDPYGTSQAGSQSLGFYTASTSGLSTGSALSVASSASSFIAGEVSAISFTVTNASPQPVVSPTFSLSVSSPVVIIANSSVSLANKVIAPGAKVGYEATVSAPSGSGGGSYSGTLTISYSDQYSNTYTQSVPVTLEVAVPIRQVSETSLSSVVMIGTPSTVRYRITNTGNVPIYSPSISLSLPSGLAVSTNSTYTRTGLELLPGQAIVYSANVTSGPKTSEGAYTGTLVASFSDQYGNQYSQTFSPGLVLVGGIVLVVQDLSATPASGDTLTVSGTLLNEGQASAYYLRVTGSASGGAPGSTYVGEVDPNTPVPFSVTVPYRATSGTSAVDLTLVSNYLNDYGQSLSSKYATTASVQGTSLGSIGSLGGQGSGFSSSATDLIRYVVLGVMLVAVVAGVIYVRRSRASGKESRKAKSDVI